MTKKGFEKHSVCLHMGISYDLYTKGPCSVLKAQVNETMLTDMYWKPFLSKISSHPLNSQVGRENVPFVQEIIKKNEDVNVSWTCKFLNGVQSSVACLQTFRDKSKIFMKAGAVCFYPLQVALLKFPEN